MPIINIYLNMGNVNKVIGEISSVYGIEQIKLFVLFF